MLKRNKIHAAKLMLTSKHWDARNSKIILCCIQEKTWIEQKIYRKIYASMFSVSSNPKKVILSKEKETKMNKIFDIFTPFLPYSVCVRVCMCMCGIYTLI